MDVTRTTDRLVPYGSKNALVAVFDAGRCFNELRWESDQAVVLRQANFEYVGKLIQGFARKLADLQPTVDQANAAWDAVLAIQSEWKGWVDSEDFGEDYFGCLEEFENPLYPTENEPVKHAFDIRLRRANDLRNQIRVLFESRIGRCEALKVVFVLGELVDQGIRPPDLVERLRRELPNPKFTGLRLPETKVPRSYTSPTPKRRIEPETIMEWAYLPPGSLPEPSWWFDRVELTLARLKTPMGKSTRLFHSDDQDLEHLEFHEYVEMLAQAIRDDLVEAGGEYGSRVGSEARPKGDNICPQDTVSESMHDERETGYPESREVSIKAITEYLGHEAIVSPLFRGLTAASETEMARFHDASMICEGVKAITQVAPTELPETERQISRCSTASEHDALPEKFCDCTGPCPKTETFHHRDELAKRAGVTSRTVGNWIAKKKSPRSKRMEELSFAQISWIAYRLAIIKSLFSHDILNCFEQSSQLTIGAFMIIYRTLDRFPVRKSSGQPTEKSTHAFSQRSLCEQFEILSSQTSRLFLETRRFARVLRGSPRKVPQESQSRNCSKQVQAIPTRCRPTVRVVLNRISTSPAWRQPSPLV
jgi:hypothetical protein